MFLLMSQSLDAQGVMVGTQQMYPMKNIIENAVNSTDHTTLVAAVKVAGLGETLMSAGKQILKCRIKTN